MTRDHLTHAHGSDDRHHEPIDTASGLGGVESPTARGELFHDREHLLSHCVQLLREGNVEEFNRLRPAGEIDLERVDLSGLDLRGVDLRHAKLEMAYLRGSDLSEAMLQHAELDRADLSQTTLFRAKFFQASLRKVNLTGVRDAREAQFQESNLRGAELDRGNFAGAYFTDAYLIGANLGQGNFRRASFEKAQLLGAILSNADFTEANLHRANLFQANGRDVSFTRANLTNAVALRAYFQSSDVEGEASGGKMSFEGAWVKGLRHDGAIPEDMLRGAISDTYPIEGEFLHAPAPDDEKILVHGIPGTDKVRFDRAMGQLDELIGLEPVKQWARKLVNYLLYCEARNISALPELESGLHMVFLGSPGTGKTTVARLVSEILSSLGCLDKGHLIETDKSGLIAGFQGQTVEKTNQLVNSALDGTLLVDEFYALFNDDKDSYAKDAVAILTKRMEDERHRLCVVACGYTEETLKTLESNPGLKSRFPDQNIVHFPDYSTGELIDILKMKMAKKHFVPTAEFLAAASMLVGVMKHREGEKFGNGRTVRNIFEATYTGPFSTRLVERDLLRDREALCTPEVRDLPFESIAKIDRNEFPPLESLRWIGRDGTEYDLDSLPTEGDFPSLDEPSMDLLGKLVEKFPSASKRKVKS